MSSNEVSEPKFKWDGERYLYKINEELDVIYKRDEFHNSKGMVRTMSFCTLGLRNIGQKELLLIIRYDNASKDMLSDAGELDLSYVYVSQLIQFFEIVQSEAKKKNIVKENGYSQIGSTETPFFGKFCGLLYSTNQLLPKGYSKLNIPSSEILVLTLVTPKEMECYRVFGGLRVLTKLGKIFAWFPFPPWNELGREGDCVDIKNSRLVQFIQSVAQISLPGVTAVFERRKVLKISIPKSECLQLSKSIQELHFEKKHAILLRSFLCEKCDSHLYFEKTRATEMCAISTQQQTTNFLGTSFVTFGAVGDDKTASMSVIEDGFAVMLVKLEYEKLMLSLKEGTRFTCSVGGGQSFCVEFVDDIVESEKKKKKPENEKSGPITKIELRSPEKDFASRKVAVSGIANLVETIERKSSLWFTKVKLIEDFSFVLHFKIERDSKAVAFEISKVEPKTQEENCYRYLVYISAQIPMFTECAKEGPEIKVNFEFSVKGNL